MGNNTLDILYNFDLKQEFFHKKEFKNLKKTSISFNNIHVLDLVSQESNNEGDSILEQTQKFIYKKIFEDSYSKDTIELCKITDAKGDDQHILDPILNNKKKYCITNRVLDGFLRDCGGYSSTVDDISRKYGFPPSVLSSMGSYNGMDVYINRHLIFEEMEMNLFDKINYHLKFNKCLSGNLNDDGTINATLEYEYFFEIINPYTIFFDSNGDLENKYNSINREFVINSLID